VLSIAGGKLTAYRRMAERVVDSVVAALGRTAEPCRTATESLPGGGAAPERVGAELEAGGLDPTRADRLAWLYGDEAPEIAAAGGDIAAEASHAVLAEGALTLEDYWARRSARAWFDPDGGMAALPAAAAVMAALLGWSADRLDEEIAACRALHLADMAGLQT
jgi:glycerol-3-phosphate dehydrogenase